MNESLAEKGASLSRVEQVYRTIRENILTNQFPPGYQALEPEIAKQLGVSRTPVREALIRLEAEKLIELIPRRGMRVLPLVPGEFLQVSQVLIALELMAIELLADRKPGRDMLSPMHDALQEMQGALEQDDLELWAEADGKFYRLLIHLCGNDRLAQIAESVIAQTQRSRMITLKMRQKPTDSLLANRNLYESLLAGEKEKARNEYSAHKMEVLGSLMDMLERYRLPHL